MSFKKVLLSLAVTIVASMGLAENDSKGPPDIIINSPEKTLLTIEEYADFQCSFCAIGTNTLSEVLKEYSGKIRVIFRNFPLKMHEKSLLAAQYMAAVYLQNPSVANSWQHQVFTNQDRMSSEGEKFLNELAMKFNLDMEKLKLDIKSELVSKMIARDQELAKALDISGTPSFLIGTKLMVGSRPYAEFKKAIEEQLK